MDSISALPDELLGKILSLVPTKLAVSTSIFSKRWKFLWMYLLKLDFIDRDESLLVLKDFIHKNLPLHRAPVIESLRLSLYESIETNIKPEDIRTWVEIAASRHLRELDVSYSSDKKENMVPDTLFACKTLVVLKLRFLTLVDVPPSTACCLPSLKTLLLELVVFEDKEPFQALLSICPVLEDLEVWFREDESMEEFAINVPSLRKLCLHVSYYWTSLERYEIDTPCLEYLDLADWNDCSCLVKNMAKLEKAHVDVVSFAVKNVIGSVTSVKHLTVCSEDVYGDGIVFDQLEQLELCICKDDSSNLLAQFLKDSPNLRVLGISQLDLHGDLKINEMGFWNQPSSVPECLLSSLEILNWGGYFGRAQDRDIAVYILRNGRQLRTATFWANNNEHDVPYLEMIKGLTLSSRASSTCELVFID
ncbi:FBD-associated F-box protein At5g38590 [Raphanus sativus]|uniref:FBD-associated F-box protein At5g38590 n=1 Tax=Raphanus sativus TaxID=3726 RepID=A0A6J0P4P6_RAPSA|nr:FBD-associated F-box protein At5g38590 [Raphanus sativus]XP_018492038.1 FBD-associated F-box protein At5g38590 [Raphanus sativus]